MTYLSCILLFIIGTANIMESTTIYKLQPPKLIAFDLDGTIWSPDMYQLWGGGSPFSGDGTTDMFDNRGHKVRILGIVRSLLHEFKSDSKWSETKFAWVSCTDEPTWAEELLSTFKTDGGDPIGSVVHSSQIFSDDKKRHFRNLKLLYPEIDFSEMLFFDNEINNIRSVSALGVKCVHCPKGVTLDAWKEGLLMFTKQLDL